MTKQDVMNIIRAAHGELADYLAEVWNTNDDRTLEEWREGDKMPDEMMPGYSKRTAPVVNWTRPKLERFKEAYHARMGTADYPGGKIGDVPKFNDANRKYVQGSNTGTFEFEGRTFVLGYAKYLIEYLDSKLAK